MQTDLALGETPAAVGVIASDQKYIVESLIQEDQPKGGDIMLVTSVVLHQLKKRGV